MLKHWYLQRFWTMIVAKNCYFWSVFPQISCGGYPQNSSKFPKPHFLLTCTYFGGRRHGRNLPMAKATDGLAFGITRHCRIKGYRPCRRPLESLDRVSLGSTVRSKLCGSRGSTSISGLSGTPDLERPCVCYADSKMKQKQVGKKRIRMYL